MILSLPERTLLPTGKPDDAIRYIRTMRERLIPLSSNRVTRRVEWKTTERSGEQPLREERRLNRGAW